MSGPKDIDWHLIEEEIIKRARERELRLEIEREERRLRSEREKIEITVMEEIKLKNLSFQINENCCANKSLMKKLEGLVNEFNMIFERYNGSKYLENKKILREKEIEIKNIINEKNISENYKINILEGFIKDIYAKENKYIEEEKRNKEILERYNDLFLSYEILNEKLDKKKTITKSEDITEIKRQINGLEVEVENLKGYIGEKEDYEYVIESVDEAMNELGYNIISSEVLKKVNRKIVDNIYEFDERSILNVFTSDNGTMMFEITGVSDKKREMSSLEKLKIKESMDSFCGEYEIIKKKLEKKGIVFGRENLRKADERYVRNRVIDSKRIKVENRMSVRKNKNRYIE